MNGEHPVGYQLNRRSFVRDGSLYLLGAGLGLSRIRDCRQQSPIAR